MTDVIGHCGSAHASRQEFFVLQSGSRRGDTVSLLAERNSGSRVRFYLGIPICLITGTSDKDSDESVDSAVRRHVLDRSLPTRTQGHF